MVFHLYESFCDILNLSANRIALRKYHIRTFFLWYVFLLKMKERKVDMWCVWYVSERAVSYFVCVKTKNRTLCGKDLFRYTFLSFVDNRPSSEKIVNCS